MNIFLIMSISSSVLLLLQIIIERLGSDLFSQRYRYGILKISLFLLFIPTIYIVKLLKNVLYEFFPDLSGNIPMNITLDGSRQTIMYTPTEVYANDLYKYNEGLTIIWVCMSFLIFTFYLWKYFKFRIYVMKATQECSSSDILNAHVKNLNIKRRIRLFTTTLNVSPFTIGIWKPIIVMPEGLDSHKQEMIMCHELRHIRNYDGLFRLIRMVIVTMYWFNPFVYLLDAYLEEASELACDEATIIKMNKEERLKYAHLIVDMCKFDLKYPESYMVSFSKNKKTIQKRLDLIMGGKNTTSLLAVLLSIGMVVCSNLTVLAYEQPNVLTWENDLQENVSIENSNQTVVFEQDSEKNLLLPVDEYIIYDSQFTDISGHTYSVDEADIISSCNHNCVDGTYKKHEKDKNGSCLTMAYSAQRCSKCEFIKLGSLNSETKYTKCPH